ncbi:Zn-dependent hydrolase [Alkalicoccus urumqiensis]|uniref:Allantoate amidohydrolase n=1 Tax=Alkalicoccus urumqiensis TaxID=1548213 RepID=A0A2P6MLL5_ALKUR|nr:Zn-dependent hydrolase [Alkalicoccus urumqiensis]PRO67171.1 allantoate amidohydrolase [Alkalicoccus urumqiensis]
MMQTQIDWLSTYTDDTPGVTRLLYSRSWCEARSALMDWMTALGMHVYEDAVGNVFGRVEGRSPEVILTGSHLDSVAHGGRFDGAAGVIASILSVARAAENGTPDYTLEVVVFCEEEGSRFPYACLGSHYVAGNVGPDVLEKTVDADGISMEKARKTAGITGHIEQNARTDIRRFMELHIEQGGILEHEGCAVGLVESIVGQRRMYIDVTGTANHAGTTPMDLRSDAMEASASMMSRMAAEARRRGAPLTATVGEMQVSPNTVNVIPGHVRFSLDFRHPEEEALASFQEWVEQTFSDTAAHYGASISFDVFMKEAPTPMDHVMTGELESFCQNEQLSCRRMHSGAGHDAQVLGRITATALLFVPSWEGISHSPEEYTEPEALEAGLTLMTNALISWAYTTKEVLT